MSQRDRFAMERGEITGQEWTPGSDEATPGSLKVSQHAGETDSGSVLRLTLARGAAIQLEFDAVCDLNQILEDYICA